MFLSCSGLLWQITNGFNISSEEGFDPVRYEYYARSELPEYLVELSSYNIVLLLKFLYVFLPNYIGYLLFIGVCFFLFLKLNDSKPLYFAAFSPITLYYIAQTGKDGLSILAVLSFALIVNKFSKWKTLLIIVVLLGLYVRPALVLFLPLIFIISKYNIKVTILFAILISFFFLIYMDTNKLYLSSEVNASQEESGLLLMYLRESTLGYTITPILYRCILYFFSPLFQPIGSLFKILNNTQNYVIFESICQLIFILNLIKHKILFKFLNYSIPFVIVISCTSPFYHFRYIAVLYPLIYAFCLQKKWYKALNIKMIG